MATVSLREPSPELRRLLRQAAEQGGLLTSDFQLARDLIELAGCDDCEPLHALILAMLLALNEGSLCLELSEQAIESRLADLVGNAEASRWARRIHDELNGLDDRAAASTLVGRFLEDGKPVVRLDRADKSFLYFHKYLRQEHALHNLLSQRLHADAWADLPEDSLSTITEILDAVRPPLNVEQQLAVALALLRRFAVISGGPGTGKTSIVVTLLRCLVRSGVAVDRIALAAPTGRAARRLTDALRQGLIGCDADNGLSQLTGRTLHQVLRFLPRRGTFRHHEENPVPADVVLVDEASMVSVGLMARLLRSIRPETRLILLGDKDQLPSVDAGAILAHLTPTRQPPRFSTVFADKLRLLQPSLSVPTSETAPMRDAVVLLRTNYRSLQAIQEIAEAVNRQDETIVERLPRWELPAEPEAAVQALAEAEQIGGVYRVPLPNGFVAHERLLRAWLRRHLFEPADDEPTFEEILRRLAVPPHENVPSSLHPQLGRLFAAFQRARALTLLRAGVWGCQGINRFLVSEARERLDRRAGGGYFVGVPIMITRNDHVRELSNGDVGVVVRSEDGGLRVVFERSDGYRSYPVGSLPAHELAFAVTVHKAQGSEFERVLLVLPGEGGRRLLTKEIIYTAITRARQFVLLVGSSEALTQAIRQRIDRQSALLRCE